MKDTACPNCHGTGRCPRCRGTGALGCPGFGEAKNYPQPCSCCFKSGVCRNAGGGRGRI